MTVNQLDLPLPTEELRSLLLSHGVQKASVFGSYSRGEATPDSDLDLLVVLAPGKDYMDLGGLQYDLEERGVKADIATKLNKRFEPYIKPDLVEIL